MFFLDKLTNGAMFRHTIPNHQPKDDGDVVQKISDDNVRGSRSVLKLVASAVGGHDAAQQDAELLASAVERGDAFLTVSEGALKPFRLEEMMTKLRSPRVSASVDLPLALLFCNGLLTCRQEGVDGKSAAEPDKVRLVLPNEHPPALRQGRRNGGSQERRRLAPTCRESVKGHRTGVASGADRLP